MKNYIESLVQLVKNWIQRLRTTTTQTTTETQNNKEQRTTNFNTLHKGKEES